MLDEHHCKAGRKRLQHSG